MSEPIHYRQTDPENRTLCGNDGYDLSSDAAEVDCWECRSILGLDTPDEQLPPVLFLLMDTSMEE